MHQNIDAENLSKAEYAEMERQAHLFASSFILPAEGFLRELKYPSLDTFVEMKARWGLSVGAMIMSCERMDVIGPEQKSHLFRYMSAKGWRKQEPLDDTLKIERPAALTDAIKLVVDAGKYTRDGFCDLVGLNSSDIENLASLPRGYLKQEAAQVVSLKRH